MTGAHGRVAVAVALAVAIAGCGSSARQARRVDVHAIAKSTDDAGTARFETTFVAWSTDDAHPKPFAQTSRQAGVIDFGNDQGQAQTEADPTPTTTLPGDPVPPDPVQHERWLGSVLYTKPGFVSGDSGKWDRLDTAQTVRPSPCRQGSFSPVSIATGSTLPLDPRRTLDDLVAAGATIMNAGTAVVRGGPTTRWNVVVHPSPACHSGAVIPEMAVFTDADQRLRRVTLRIPVTGSDLPPMVVTTDFFDFGVPVHVEAPPDSEVTDITEFMAALYAGPGTVDEGWRSVAHNRDGAAFTVWFAHTSTGWRCFDLEPNPSAVLGSISAGAHATNVPPLHDGHQSQCLYRGAPPGIGIQGFVVRTTGDTEQIVVALAPGYANARLVHSDGSTTAVPVDPATGVVDWTGPATPPITKVEADGTLGTAECATSLDEVGGVGGVGVVGGILGSPGGPGSLPGLCALSP